MKIKAANRQTRLLLEIVLILRALLPIILFTQPVVAIIISLLLDAVDGQLFFNLGFKWRTYNLIDKVFDYLWYLSLFAFLILSNPEVSNIALGLLLLRTIGQLIGVLFAQEKAYLFFPNAFEWFAFLVILSNIQTEFAVIISLLVGVSVELWFHVLKPNLGSKLFFRREIKWKLG